MNRRARRAEAAAGTRTTRSELQWRRKEDGSIAFRLRHPNGRVSSVALYPDDPEAIRRGLLDRGFAVDVVDGVLAKIAEE